MAQIIPFPSITSEQQLLDAFMFEVHRFNDALDRAKALTAKVTDDAARHGLVIKDCSKPQAFNPDF